MTKRSYINWHFVAPFTIGYLITASTMIPHVDVTAKWILFQLAGYIVMGGLLNHISYILRNR